MRALKACARRQSSSPATGALVPERVRGIRSRASSDPRWIFEYEPMLPDQSTEQQSQARHGLASASRTVSLPCPEDQGRLVLIVAARQAQLESSHHQGSHGRLGLNVMSSNAVSVQRRPSPQPARPRCASPRLASHRPWDVACWTGGVCRSASLDQRAAAPLDRPAIVSAPIEDDCETPVGHGMPHQVLRTTQLVVASRRNRSLKLERGRGRGRCRLSCDRSPTFDCEQAPSASAVPAHPRAATGLRWKEVGLRTLPLVGTCLAAHK